MGQSSRKSQRAADIRFGVSLNNARRSGCGSCLTFFLMMGIVAAVGWAAWGKFDLGMIHSTLAGFFESVGTVRDRLRETKCGATISAPATFAEPAAIADWIWCTAGYYLDWIRNFAIALMAVFARIAQNVGDEIVQLLESFQK